MSLGRLGSSLGVRRCEPWGEDLPVIPSPLSELELWARVGDELWERCPDDDDRRPYCCNMKGGVGGSSGMSAYGIMGTCIIGIGTAIGIMFMFMLIGIVGTGGTPHGKLGALVCCINIC